MTPETHIDPHGAEFAVACLYCGRVHRSKAERRDITGKVVPRVTPFIKRSPGLIGVSGQGTRGNSSKPSTST